MWGSVRGGFAYTGHYVAACFETLTVFAPQQRGQLQFYKAEMV